MGLDLAHRSGDRPDMPASGPKIGLSVLEGMEVRVEAFLGARTLTVGELVALGPGGVLELEETLAAEVELRVNGSPVARGELVAVGDRFGVRITSVAG